MGGGNPTDVLLRDLAMGSTTRTGGLSELNLKKVKMHILEMEDVLFHLSSAVMMPERPKGASSSQGKPDPAQDKISGIQALAVAFKQFEADPRRRLLIAGHTDTSGEPAMNFELSRERADNVLHLLEGNRDLWAEVSRKRHRIEDYQQIMRFLAENKRWGWSCDPVNLDNKWAEPTRAAIAAFKKDYDAWVAAGKAPSEATPLPGDLAAIVEKDPKHEWPLEAWKAAYDIYNAELAAALKVDIAQLNTRYRPMLDYVQPNELPSAVKRTLRMLFPILFQTADARRKTVGCGESFPIDSAEKANYKSQVNRRVVLLFFDQDEMPIMNCPARVKTVHTDEECPLWHKLSYIPVYIDKEDLNKTVVHLKFQYYDHVYGAFKEVPEGLNIRTIENGTTDVATTITYANSMYLVKLPNTPRTSLQFSFMAPDAWIHTKDASTPPKIRTRAEIETELGGPPKDQPFSERMKYYRLPDRWESKNWTVQKGTTWGPFEDLVKKTTTTAEPLVIDLDSVVLTSAALVPLGWNPDHRFTAFNIGMELMNPDPDRPFWNKEKLTRNFMTPLVTGARPRVVALNGSFYDVTTKRTISGDVIGARAAVLNDPDVHFGAAQRAPVVSLAGNFELHYFKDCLDSAGKDSPCLLIYWSCIFEKRDGATDADIENFMKSGMDWSKTRWDRKQYRFTPKTDPAAKNITVRPVYFFEGRTGTPYKCTVYVRPADPTARANMGLDEGNFLAGNHQPSTAGASYVEDGDGYKAFTMAHELGHATGLHDEYLESLAEDKSWSPTLPTFARDQWYNGMPYSCDDASMMVTNFVPRLRSFWYFCRWLNETNEVKAFTANTEFHIVTTKGKARTFTLPEPYKDFYKSAYDETNVSNGTHGEFDLFLYKCGVDESTDRMIYGKSDFDGILVVRSKLQWFFDDHEGAAWANDEAKLDYLRQLQNRIAGRMNGTFYMDSPTDATFKKIFIYFVLHYYFEGATTHDHFEITVKANNTGTARYAADFNADGFHGDEFSVDQLQNEITMFRYVLGLAPTKATASGNKEAIVSIDANDLDFLARWVAAKRGGGVTYTVRK
jgi:hypothetical protein